MGIDASKDEVSPVPSNLFDSSTLLFRLPPTLPPLGVILPSVSEGEGYVLSSIPRGT